MQSLFTILLAEDDANDALLIQRAFSKAGIRNPIHIVSDGEEAISYLQGTGKYADRAQFPFPGCFITDLKMPRKSGFDVLEWVKSHEECRVIPTIVLSSSKQPDDIKRAYHLGINSYFVKPADFAELQELARKIHDYWACCQKPELDGCS